jgi:hypothetical protein
MTKKKNNNSFQKGVRTKFRPVPLNNKKLNKQEAINTPKSIDKMIQRGR